MPKKDEDVLFKHSMKQAPGSHPVTVAPATSVKAPSQNRWEQNSGGDSISLRNKEFLITGYT